MRNTIRRSGRERARRIDRAFEVFVQILLVLYFLFVLSSWLSEREVFRITEVVVSGTLAVDAEAAKNIIEDSLERPLLWKIDRNNQVLYPRRGMITAIESLDSHVKSVDIAIVERKRLVATVTEYAPELLWCPPDFDSASTTAMEETSTPGAIRLVGCYFADAEGHIFARAPEYSGNPFLVFATAFPGITGDIFLDDFSILPKEEFAKVALFLSELRTIGLVPHIVREVGEHDFLFTTDEPWTIRWSSTGDPEADGTNLTLALEHLSRDQATLEGLKTIDLRFGNKVFYTDEKDGGATSP